MELSAKIINGAPMVIQMGTKDASKYAGVREALQLPQHLPLFYLYGQKGGLGRTLIDNESKNVAYGPDTFDYRLKYTTHQNVYLNEVLKRGNMCITERIVPEDIRPESNLILWLEIIKCDVDIYDRDEEKMVKYDGINPVKHNEYPSTNTLQYDPTDPKALCYGYKARWMLTYRDDTPGSGDANRDPDMFGKAKAYNRIWSNTGEKLTAWDPIIGHYQTAVVNSSTVYPIYEMKASSMGSWGDDIGIRFYAPGDEEKPLPQLMMRDAKAYPYVFSVVQRPDKNSSPVIQSTKHDTRYNLLTLKDGVINPLTDDQMYIGDKFIDAYRNIKDPNYPFNPGQFGDLKVYDDNVEFLASSFHLAESRINYALELADVYCDGALYGGVFGGDTVPMSLMEANDPKLDFTIDSEDRHLVNMVSMKASGGVAYHSLQLAPGNQPEHITLTRMTNLMAKGGSDGTLDEGFFDAEVARRITGYTDDYSGLTDPALNPESIFYDSGFTLQTKKKLPAFIAKRKDTFVVLSTHTNLYYSPTTKKYSQIGMDFNRDQELSIGQSLRTSLQMYPESEYFGTPTMRGMIVAHSGTLIGSTYKKRIPLSIEIAIKSAIYMGDKSGKWTPGKNFSRKPGSLIQYVENLSVKHIPSLVRNEFWDAGIVFAVASDMESFFIPALKTCYVDFDSVSDSTLNSFFTALAIGYLNKITYDCWAEYSGADDLSDRELSSLSNEYVSERTKGIYDGKYVIIPKALVTEADALRGYSWTLPVDIYSNNMRSVMSTYVTAKKMSMLGE